MKNYVLIVLLPTTFAYLISIFFVDFVFLYYLAFGLTVVGIDLFTMSTFETIKHSRLSILGTYLLLLFSIGMLVYKILGFYTTDGSELYQLLISLLIGIPIALFAYKQFFINHIAGNAVNNQQKN